jgi:hypothetical protein
MPQSFQTIPFNFVTIKYLSSTVTYTGKLVVLTLFFWNTDNYIPIAINSQYATYFL